jgi:D-proline reductase (dithiol) PrdB
VIIMARLEDLPEPTRTVVIAAPCPSFESRPFVGGPPLAQRRVAIINSAAMIMPGEAPFAFGSIGYRTIPADRPAAAMLTSHVSIAHDRSGFQRDINTVHPIDRLREMARDGMIGGVAETHYTVLGSSDALAMSETVDQIAGQLRQERVDAVLFSPV